jgi:hypothetical protein
MPTYARSCRPRTLTTGNVVFGGAAGEVADTDSQFHTITVQGVTDGVTGTRRPRA